jgi:hydrogenase maturation protease
MIVIGLGNEFRRDDGIGLICARQLRERGVPAEEHAGDLTDLMHRWTGVNDLILLDGIASGAAPGTVHRLDVSVSPLNRDLVRGSTHALGLADALELSRQLGTLPARVWVFGVEVRDVRVGLGLSPEVASALPALVEEVLRCARQVGAIVPTSLRD